MDRILDILIFILGQPKSLDGGDNLQYQFECPECGDGNKKHNLEINLKIGKYHCWSCEDINNTKGSIIHLIKKYGNEKLLKEYKEELKSLKESISFDLSGFLNGLEILNEIDVELPTSYHYINKEYDKLAYNYLVGRGLNDKIIKELRIGVTTNSDPTPWFRNRIIIPSYDSFNKLNYWVGRDFSNNKNKNVLKYMNPKVDKHTIIFNESNINWDADVYIVEGPFDLLSMPKNTIALLGKTIREDSLIYRKLIREATANIILCLDSDALANTKKLFKLLNGGRLLNKIRYCVFPDGEDPSSMYQKYGYKGVVEVLKHTKQLNNIELLNV